uniref:Putative ovule protein n=1 Tax=Solanum chacoense TaxID=4108 RepID=A0A0V0H662_SOLCH
MFVEILCQLVICRGLCSRIIMSMTVMKYQLESPMICLNASKGHCLDALISQSGNICAICALLYCLPIGSYLNSRPLILFLHLPSAWCPCECILFLMN